MPLFEIPSSDGYHADVIFVRDQNNPDDPVYTHYAFTRGTTANPNEIRQRRGIPFNNFRAWEWFCREFPDVEQNLDESKEYYPGESVLGSVQQIDPNFQVNTAMRLGALEILANIFSGRITANDKDPFPHQLALQQYVKTNENRVRDFQAIKSPNTRMIIIVRRGKEKQPSSAAFPSPFCSKFN